MTDLHNDLIKSDEAFDLIAERHGKDLTDSA
jgi:hypothetical protein